MERVSGKLLILSILLMFFAPPAFAQSSAKQVLRDGEPFSPNGKIETYKGRHSSPDGNDKTESGTINGVYYNFSYTDGWGSFAADKESMAHYSEPRDKVWAVQCKKDPINEQKAC